MLIKNVFMELRSRLRSCNVFITTGIDFSKNYNLKISIQANCIVFNYYDDDRKRRDSLSSIESLSDCSEDESDVTTVIQIQEYCQIIPNSMSSLKIDKNTISFRILTEPKKGGNFYKEILATKNDNAIKMNSLKINVKTDTDVKLICANCSNIVSNGLVKFDRVLELPSSNIDMSEWFCHGHCHGNTSQTEVVVMKQNKTDFLYRLTYFVVNVTLLSEKTNKFNSKRNVYHCNRCLAWLGLKDKDTVKLYNSDVVFNYNNAENRVFNHNISEKNIPTNDFIYTIEKLIKEFDLGFQYTVMCKIVLECCVSSAKKQYILIWVMDKELQVLRNNGEYIVNEKIVLQSHFLTKILYKVELSFNSEVESWLADPSVVSSDISKSMFSNGLEQLEEMSMKVPESFRVANGYFVSYLKV